MKQISVKFIDLGLFRIQARKNNEKPDNTLFASRWRPTWYIPWRTAEHVSIVNIMLVIKSQLLVKKSLFENKKTQSKNKVYFNCLRAKVTLSSHQHKCLGHAKDYVDTCQVNSSGRKCPLRGTQILGYPRRLPTKPVANEDSSSYISEAKGLANGQCQISEITKSFCQVQRVAVITNGLMPPQGLFSLSKHSFFFAVHWSA